MEAIHVNIKSQYGSNVIVPVNEQAKKLAQLAGTKTLTRRTIEQAHSMGFEIWYAPNLRAFSPVKIEILADLFDLTDPIGD